MHAGQAGAGALSAGGGELGGQQWKGDGMRCYAPVPAKQMEARPGPVSSVPWPSENGTQMYVQWTEERCSPAALQEGRLEQPTGRRARCKRASKLCRVRMSIVLATAGHHAQASLRTGAPGHRRSGAGLASDRRAQTRLGVLGSRAAALRLAERSSRLPPA